MNAMCSGSIPGVISRARKYPLALLMAVGLLAACGQTRTQAQSTDASPTSALDAKDVGDAVGGDSKLSSDAPPEVADLGLCKDVTCTDGNPCTSDGCDPLTGCTFVPVPDGQPCGHMGKAVCNSGTCAAKGCGKMSGVEMGAPWPMQGGCPSHSRQSAYLGPQTPKVKWMFTDEDLGEGNPTGAWTEVVIGARNVAYLGAKMHVFSIDSDGKLVWKLKTSTTPHDHTSGAVGNNGAVHIVDNLWLLAIDKAGQLQWKLYMNGGSNSAPTLAPDGTLLVGTQDKRLAAVNPDGSPKWDFKADDRIFAGPAIGGNGLIYFGSLWKYMHVVDQMGKEKWAYELAGENNTSAMTGQDDRVYITSQGSKTIPFKPGRIYAFGRDPWEYIPTGDFEIRTWDSIALSDSGTVYHSNRCLEAISANGQKMWDFADGSSAAGCTPATIGADGTIYVAQSWARCTPLGGKGQQACHNDLYALNPDGSMKWQWQTPDVVNSHPSLSPPVLDANGTLYVYWTAGSLYAFGD